jgi:hypothetical protein
MKIIIVLLQVYFSFVVIVVMEFLSKSQIISPTGSTKKHWNENGWKKDGLDGSDGHHPENLMEMHMECMLHRMWHGKSRTTLSLRGGVM